MYENNSGSDEIHCHIPFPPSNVDFISFHVLINDSSQDLISGILGSSKNSITAKVIAMSGVVRRCVVISSHVTCALVELKIVRTRLQ